MVGAKKTFLGFSAKPHTFQEKGISEAGQALYILRLDTAERRRYARFIGNLRDERSLIQTHDESGRRKGFKVGIEQDVHCGTGLYPFQNETWISNRGGSIFLICDQNDLERHPLPVSFWNGYMLHFHPS